MADNSSLILYAVSGESEEGQSFNIYIWAGSPDEAARLFQQHFNEFELPEEVLIIRVPTTPRRGIVDWDGVERTEFQLEEATEKELAALSAT